MATATGATVQTKFEILPLAHITPSPMNPRKRFDEKALKELADSIKAHGVQQPIVVRPMDTRARVTVDDGKPRKNTIYGDVPRYEIVVGERRYRASKLAGNAEIPALINHLSNAAALEIMVIENLQRENVHPLEEALGYEALMRKPSETDPELGELPGSPRHTVQSIAAKVGKSVEYVYARLKLLALVPAAREAFEQGHVTAGHAVLIARLQPGDQLKALAACFKNYVTQFEEQALKKLEPMVATWFAVGEAVNLPIADAADDAGFGGPSDSLRLASEKFLRAWIQEHINLKLKGVPWDLDDDKLVPGAGPCALCPKRSMSNPSLFAELTKKGEDDTCFDPGCFQAKQKAYVKLQVKSARTSEAPLVQISEQTAYTKPKEGEKVLKAGQWLPAKKGECAGVAKALIVRGERAGEHETVCADLNCKVHKRHLSTGGTGFSPQEENSFNRQEQAAKDRIDELVVEKVLATAVAKIKKPDAKVLRTILAARFSNWYGELDLVGRVLGLKFKTPDDSNAAVKTFMNKADLAGLTRLMFLVTLSEDLVVWSPELKAMAKEYGIDMAKVRKEIEKSQTPAKPAAPAKAKKAKAGK